MNDANSSAVILNAAEIQQKLDRLAYQIWEQNFDEKQMVICGISERGFQLAKVVHDRLRQITPFQLELVNILLEKHNLPESPIRLEPVIEKPEEKTVIICDDVLYTGRTLAYASIPFLNAGVKKLECLVLISRNHLKFPVYPAYIGMSLATTLQEHVRVQLQDTPQMVILS
jgi:pyrimidine operon attenuation protein/uracil phosphoribosyltransferase